MTNFESQKNGTAVKPFRARGRFDIMFVFDDGASLRITSQKTKSLTAAEVVASLREYCDHVEKGIAAGKIARGETDPTGNHGRSSR